MKYHVTYFYSATGTEGKEKTQDYGFVEADTPEEAIEIIVLDEYPKDIIYAGNLSSRNFLRGCLTAKPTKIVR